MNIKTLHTQYHNFAFSYNYDTAVVEYCRELKERWGNDSFNYDTTHKEWVFSEPIIAATIMQRYPDCVVGKETLTALEEAMLAKSKEIATNQKLTEIKQSEDSSIEIPGLKGTPYPFQKVGMEFLVKSGGRALLCDDPGLGKTLQTIGAILCLRPTKSLIICPATMKYTWEMEVKKWSGLSVVVIKSDTIISKIPADTDVFVVNYDLLKKHLGELIKIPFEFLGLDESHYIKTANTIRSRAVRILANRTKYVVMLTGTPVLNRPVELFNPLNILDPKKWNNYYSFVNKYCGAHRTRFGMDVSGATNSAELKVKLDKYMLRRRKEEVLKDLPEKIRVEVPVNLDEIVGKTYNKAYHSFAKYLRENKDKNDTEIKKALQAEKLVRLNHLRELSAIGKAKDAVELINNIIAGGEKVVVFASFIAPLRQLSDAFGEAAVMITGETDNEERFEIVKRFQEDPNIKVFLGGFKSAGVGITLTAASNVLFLDYPWTPADAKQAEDRAHRIGSMHDSITIYQMKAFGTIDDLMAKMLAKKRSVVEGLIGEGDDQSSMSMVLEDITNQMENENDTES